MVMQTSGRVLNVAVVGCKMGENHASAWKRCSNGRLAAVVDLNLDLAKELGNKFDVPAFDSIGKAIKGTNIDLIDVVVPTEAHAKVAIQAAELGKHCIVEKPIALNQKEFDDMQAAFSKSGTVLGGIFQHRFTDMAFDARKILGEGSIGDIYCGSSQTIWWRKDDYWDRPERCTPETAGGGVLMVHAIHAIDLLVHLMGSAPVSAEAIISKGRALPEKVKIEHTGGAVIGFDNGAVATVLATLMSKSGLYEGKASHLDVLKDEKHTVSIVGSKGRIVIETPQGEPEVYFSRNLDDIALAAINGTVPLVSGESAWRTVQVIQAMYRGANGNRI